MKNLRICEEGKSRGNQSAKKICAALALTAVVFMLTAKIISSRDNTWDASLILLILLLACGAAITLLSEDHYFSILLGFYCLLLLL